MNTNDNCGNIEIRLATACLLIGKTIKTMQRWCDEKKIESRVIDLRGKRIVSLNSVMQFTCLSVRDCHLVHQADCGDAEAKNEVGIAFLELNKPLIAIGWFQEAARARHPDAMHSLFRYYFYGDMGVVRNEALGISWLASAATAGHYIAKAQMNALYLRKG